MIQLTRYNYDAKKTESVTAHGEIDARTVAHGLRHAETMADLLEHCMNGGGQGRIAAGRRVGQHCRTWHRALQRYLVDWTLGLLFGIADQEHWDPRNAAALAIARQIKADYYDGRYHSDLEKFA